MELVDHAKNVEPFYIKTDTSRTKLYVPFSTVSLAQGSIPSSDIILSCSSCINREHQRFSVDNFMFGLQLANV